MKKTFTINMSGTVFHIEEDAYEVLQKYLVKLKNHFGSEEDGKEILADIEARIAEIFIDKTSDENRVITSLLVYQVIETMGTPEDFAEEEIETEEYIPVTKRRKRLYRDPEHRVMGGVCSGLGAYFNMDPVILRILFVVLLIVTSILPALLAYFILWIAVPKATTTTQRLEMRGQEATIKNIEKSIREEVKEVKESYKKFKNSESYSQGKKKVEGAGQVTYNVFKLILKIALVALGVILIISGFLGLLGLISSLTIGHSLVNEWPMIWSPEINFPEFLTHFVEPGIMRLSIIFVGVLAGIPLLAILYIGSKLVFRYKSNNTVIGLGLAGVWILSLILLVILSINQIGNFKNQASIVENYTLPCDSCQTLWLKSGEDRYKGYVQNHWELNKL
ncbi:MAG: PspC domain-containing protein, partial [Mariniphaga sp.]|nr:PspC domain-containing protein [Mariniphaga sp.]